MGTAIGGFAGWIGIIICSGSTDNNPDPNPYALTAYLTVIAVVTAFVGTDPGIASMFGASGDHGAWPKYLMATCTLVSLEVYAGLGSRDELTVNRVVATITGVLMAIVVSAIPPVVRGGDDLHIRNYQQALTAAFIELLKGMLNKDAALQMRSDEYQESFLRDATIERNKAMLLLKDASMLKCLPIFRVDKSPLQPLIESMAADEALLGVLFQTMTTMMDTNGDLQTIENDYKGTLETLLKRTEVPTDKEPQSNGDSLDYLISGGPDLGQWLVNGAELVADRLESHRKILDGAKD